MKKAETSSEILSPSELFGQKLSVLMKRKEMTQDDLGQAIGKAQSRVSLWMNGTGDPSPHLLYQIARALVLEGEDPLLIINYLSDISRQLLPLPDFMPVGSLSEAERMLLAMAREISGGVQEAVRRIFPLDPSL